MKQDTFSHGAVVVPDLLAIRSTIPEIFRYPLASRLAPLKTIETAVAACPMVVDYQVGPLGMGKPSPGGKYFSRQAEQTLYYETPLGAFGNARLELRWSDTNPQLKVNSLYHRLGKVSIETVHSTGRHLRDITNLLLARNGYAVIHSAALSHGDRAVMLVGLSNTGKTTSTINFVQHHSAKLFGDDLMVSDGVRAYACPMTRANLNPEFAPSRGYRWHQAIRRVIPFFENYVGPPKLTISDYFGAAQIASPCRVTDLFILIGSDRFSKRTIDEEEALRLLYASNHAEFTHNTNQVLWAGDYLGAGVPLFEGLRQEQALLQRLTRNAHVHCLEGGAEDFRREVAEQLFD